MVARTSALLCSVIACASEPRPAPPVEPPPTRVAARDSQLRAGAPADAATPDAPGRAEAPSPDGGPAFATLDDALAGLRGHGLDRAATAIARRAAQPRPKMRLSPAQAIAAAEALLALVAVVPAVRELHAVMPRSTVELARAVRERGVTPEDADDIARYLVRFADVLAFARLDVFDENHSHVTGRQWHEIDYSGEGMTWQRQRDYWLPRGVIDFRRVEHIHAYFVGASRLPHWQRVYRPRGKVADVPPPERPAP
jgi:hypothetical protein